MGKNRFGYPEVTDGLAGFGLNDAASLPLVEADLSSNPIFGFQNRRLGQTPETGQQAQTEDERPDSCHIRHRRSQ